MQYRRVGAVAGLMLVSAVSMTDLRAQEVPVMPPDTVPATLAKDADLVERHGGLWVSTSVLMTLFQRSASQAERQAAVDLVGGVVIGGLQFAGDGMYLIKVPGDSTVATIDSINTVLQSLPQVASSGTYSVGGVGIAAEHWGPRGGAPDEMDRAVEVILTADGDRVGPRDEPMRYSIPGAGAASVSVQEVPAVPPDSVPSTLAEQANLVEVNGMQVSTSVLMTLFDATAPQADRQAAVDLVGGSVIGGVRAAGDGIYLVLVPGDSTLTTIDSIASVLKALPQVAGVGPYRVGGT